MRLLLGVLGLVAQVWLYFFIGHLVMVRGEFNWWDMPYIVSCTMLGFAYLITYPWIK